MKVQLPVEPGSFSSPKDEERGTGRFRPRQIADGRIRTIARLLLFALIVSVGCNRAKGGRQLDEDILRTDATVILRAFYLDHKRWPTSAEYQAGYSKELAEGNISWILPKGWEASVGTATKVSPVLYSVPIWIHAGNDAVSLTADVSFN